MYNVANNAYTELATAIGSSATQLTVFDGSGFPEPPFVITVTDGEVLEIIEVNAKSGNTFSGLVRGAEGTVARGWDAGAIVENRWTAGTYKKLKDALQALTPEEYVTRSEFIWSNLTGKPSSTPSAIDSAVSQSHTHSNKSVLDTITQTHLTKLAGIEEGANKYVHPTTHPASMIVEETDKRFMTDAERSKLAGIEAGANKYVHPATHPASMIEEETDKRFMTDSERNKLAGIEAGANKYVHPATHPASMIEEETDKRFMTDAERNKLAGIESGANKYVHPATHPASMIVEEKDKRFMTDAERAKLEGIEAGAQVNTVTSVNSKTGAVTITKSDVGLGSVQNYGIANQTQAEAGSADNVYMTPLKTKYAIASLQAVKSVAGKTGAVTLSSSDVGLGSVQNYGIASQTEAEAGTSNAAYMTPLRTKQAIDILQAVKSVNGKTGAVTLGASDVGLGNVQNYGVATQAQAEAGTATNAYMTPQRTAQAIAVLQAVKSVNGKTGAVTLTATDVGAVQSVNSKTGAVTLTASDIGLGNVQNYGIATQAQAEAGTATNVYMTPQRTAQAIAALQSVKSVAGKTGAVTLTASDVGLGSVQNYGIATQSQAETGSVDNVYMTPLKTKYAISALQAVKSVAGKTGAVTLTASDVGLGSVQNYGIASQTQAEAGSVDNVYMTPLKTKQAIAALQSVKSVNGKTGAVSLTASDVGLGNVQNYGIASLTEAEVGTATNKYMTPATVKRAIETIPAIYKDRGTDPDYSGVKYKLVVIDGKPYLEVVEA